MVLEVAAARGVREAAERAPKMSLGLHFVVTGGGRPAAAARDVPTLAPGGFFRRTRGELPPTIPAGEIRAELEAQIHIFQVLARKPPSHLDSHHHAALHAAVAPVFAAVAKERSLPVRAADAAARKALVAAGAKTPDRFLDGFHAEGVTFETLERILTTLPDGTSELMCHPGRVDDVLKGGSSYVDQREWEVELLCDPRIRQLVRSLKIALVGFDAL
jgi:predicted glycoside hydrolase/deacetylase ChbG (UPF0249 family)